MRIGCVIGIDSGLHTCFRENIADPKTLARYRQGLLILSGDAGPLAKNLPRFPDAGPLFYSSSRSSLGMDAEHAFRLDCVHHNSGRLHQSVATVPWHPDRRMLGQLPGIFC